MAMGRRKDRARTPRLWIATNELPVTGGHPFYRRLNQVLDTYRFDEVVDAQSAPFYATKPGRPSLTPGTYVRAGRGEKPCPSRGSDKPVTKIVQCEKSFPANSQASLNGTVTVVAVTASRGHVRAMPVANGPPTAAAALPADELIARQRA
jgi:hypothetical protein